MCETFVLKNVIGIPLILLSRALPVTSVTYGITMAVLKLRGMNLFLFKKNSRWVCQTCKPTAKSKGKGKGKGKGKK